GGRFPGARGTVQGGSSAGRDIGQGGTGLGPTLGPQPDVGGGSTGVGAVLRLFGNTRSTNTGFANCCLSYHRQHLGMVFTSLPADFHSLWGRSHQPIATWWHAAYATLVFFPLDLTANPTLNLLPQTVALQKILRRHHPVQRTKSSVEIIMSEDGWGSGQP